MKIFFIKNYNIWTAITACEYNKNSAQNLIENIIKKRKQLEILQVVDLKKIVSYRQILSAIYRTYRNFERKKNIAKEKSVEVLLRITGKRQISEAIATVGVDNETREIVIFACDKAEENVKKVIEEIIKDNGLKVKDEELDNFEKRKNELIKTFNLVTNNIEKEILTRIASIDWYY